MTTYSKFLIAGSEVAVENFSVTKTTGDMDASGKFSANVNNYIGDKSTDFTIGDEVKIYCDKDTVPPTTQIFLGILENTKLAGREQSETLNLSGRDYSARLMDRTVEPEVYNNLPAGSIINDIITKYTDDITTTNVSSGLNVDRIVFNHIPVYDAVKQLAERNNYMFYVDNTKDLHFKEKAITSSGYTFGSGGSPITTTSFQEKRDEVYNEIWVYGDRYLDGYAETFDGNQGTSGTIGSIFTLEYKPSNTSVTVDSVAIQPGGIFEMSYGVGSNVKYLVNYSDKQIVFTSGTSQGNNNPAAGESVVVSYMRDLPIVKFGENDGSITKYGKKIKVIQDKSIKDPIVAETILLRELDEYSDPQKQGSLNIRNVCNITPGETCVVNIPMYDINSTTYDMLEAKYDFNKRSMLADNVLSIKLNKKIPDITDTLKKILLEQKKLQSQDMQDSDLLTRYKISAGSFGIRASGLSVFSRNINDSFIAGHDINGVVGVVNPNTIGSVISGNSWVAGVMGSGYNKAINFTGAQYNYITMQHNNKMVLTSGTTFAGWFKLSDVPGVGAHKYRPGIAAYNVNAYDSFITFDENDGNGYKVIYEDNSGSTRRSGSFAYTVDDWIHVALSMDDTKAPNFYINGSLNNDYVISSDDIDINYIGTGYAGATNKGAFYGDIDEIRFYNRELSEGEIGSLYDKKNVKGELTHYYKIDEGIGSFAYNSASVEMPTYDAVAHWRFNQSGTTLIDSVGSYDATGISGPTFVAGVYGNGSALAFGSPEYATYPTTEFNVGSPLSLTGWLRLGSDGYNSAYSQPLILANYIKLGLRAITNNLTIRYDNAGARVVNYTVGEGDRDWHHFAGTFDGGSELELYVDGTSKGSGNFDAIPDTNYGTYIGRFSNGFFSGAMDELRIYNRVLSSGEVLNLYEGKTIQPLLGDRRTGSTLQWSGAYF